MNKEIESTRSVNNKRRNSWLLLITGVAMVALVALIIVPDAQSTVPRKADIVVYKTASCSCCGKWVAHLRDAGLDVRAVNVTNTQATRKLVGVPNKLGSCHTAVVGDYWVEGHVPADLVRRLMTEKPESIKGIAVPSMPPGSPGMESPNPVTYNVLAYDSDGNTSVYATRQGQTPNRSEEMVQ